VDGDGAEEEVKAEEEGMEGVVEVYLGGAGRSYWTCVKRGLGWAWRTVGS
jgi:hypothetical protein